MQNKHFLFQWILGTLATMFSWTMAHAAEPDAILEIESVVLRPLQVAEVPAQQTGLLKQIAVAEGQQVEQGRLLASLDVRGAEYAVRQAELEHELAGTKVTNDVQLRYAEKALEVARAELDRSRESVESFAKSISQSQLDVERLTVEKLVLETEQAKHDLEIERFGLKLKQNALEAARLRLQQHHLRAPFAGTIALIRGQVGEWVEMGSPVLRLVAVERLRAEGFLPAEQASDQIVGAKVRLKVALFDNPTAEFTGTLQFVSPEMDPVTRQVRVWAEIENQGRQLRPGQRGRLSILKSKSPK